MQFSRCHLDANQCELLFPSDSSLWCTNRSLTLKRRVLKGRWPPGKRCGAPAKSMTWMKQTDEGKWKWLGCELWQAVRNQCQLLWMGNRCWANEKRKKERRKDLSFFIRHPRIINCVQAFWWGWRKPQDTWLASRCAGGQWNTKTGEKQKQKKVVLLGDKVEELLGATDKEGRWTQKWSKNWKMSRCVSLTLWLY